MSRSLPRRDVPAGLAAGADHPALHDLARLAARATSWAGEADLFLWLLEELADLCVRHPGFVETLQSAPESAATLRRTLVAGGARALRDAQLAGVVGTDLEVEDILTFASLLGAGFTGDVAAREAMSLRTRKARLGRGLEGRRIPGVAAFANRPQAGISKADAEAIAEVLNRRALSDRVAPTH